MYVYRGIPFILRIDVISFALRGPRYFSVKDVGDCNFKGKLEQFATGQDDNLANFNDQMP